MKKAVRFWTDRVGLRVKEGNEDWVELQTEGTTLALHKASWRATRETGINFWVREIDGVYKELSRRGVRFRRPPQKEPWGGMLAKFFDEEGNVFRLEGD